MESPIIIATSILTGIPGAIGQALEQARQGDLNILLLLGIGVLAMLVIAIVVFIERGQRRITVNYAQRQQGRKLMQAQASHLPFKVNMAGVIPAIFLQVLFYCSQPHYLHGLDRLNHLVFYKQSLLL